MGSSQLVSDTATSSTKALISTSLNDTAIVRGNGTPFFSIGLERG